MKFFLMLMSFLFATTVYADITQQSGKILIQNVSAPELDVFCNQKDSALILDRVDFNNPGVQAGWASTLPPHMCSIFFTDKSPFTFACSEESSGGFKQVDCQPHLLVGPLTWSGKMLSNQTVSGSYWVAEAISVDDVPLVVRHRGFDL
ncbi:MAG: hypothetical protein V4496_03260 [Pseudomonadota bacterium]